MPAFTVKVIHHDVSFQAVFLLFAASGGVFAARPAGRPNTPAPERQCLLSSRKMFSRLGKVSPIDERRNAFCFPRKSEILPGFFSYIFTLKKSIGKASVFSLSFTPAST